MAAVTALMLGWIKWRQAPRGATGLLIQYGALSAMNGWVVLAETTNPVLVWSAVAPVVVLWLAPVWLRTLAETQLRIGRPGPVGWMLLLRAMIAWHRRHLVDYVFAPVRLLLAAGKRDMAVELARRLQGMWILRGMEPEQTEMLASALMQSGRWPELLADPVFAEHAAFHPPLRLALARAKTEAGDYAGAAMELQFALAAGAPGITVELAWAKLLAATGRLEELVEWTTKTGLAEHPQLGRLVTPMLKEASEKERNEAPDLPETPSPVLDEQRSAAELEARMRAKGPLSLFLAVTMVLFWLPFWYLGGHEDGGLLIAWGATAPPLIEAGQWWRAITTTWLHGSWLHIILNALNTLVIVPFAVALVGKRLTLLAWVVSAIGGTLGSMYSGVPLSVGASGAIMGIVGLVLGVLARKPPEVPEAIRRHYFRTLLFLTGIIFFYGYSVDGIVDNGGHLGGLAAGALLGVAMPVAALREKPIPTGWLLAAAVAPVLLLIGTLMGIISAAQGGTLPDPMPHQQAQVGRDAIPLALPVWWERGSQGIWSDPTTRLQIYAIRYGPGAGALSMERLTQDMLDDDGFGADAVKLRRPAETLESGVERRILDVEFQGVVHHWVLFVARRGGRAVVLRALGYKNAYRLYAGYLDALAARATPQE